MGNKNISQEPEIKELKRMIVEGKLGEGSVLNQVKERIEREAVKEGRQGNCLKWTKRGRIPWIRVKERSLILVAPGKLWTILNRLNQGSQRLRTVGNDWPLNELLGVRFLLRASRGHIKDGAFMRIDLSSSLVNRKKPYREKGGELWRPSRRS